VIFFIVAVSALLAAAGIAEYRIHISRLEKIPVRILVNGTRGKSTVTRLIAAGLAEGGLRVCAKTTGSAAKLLLPDLSEEPIRRRKGASIMEHAWFVRRALGLGARAIVAECMAIQPETIRTLERRLARSTIGVVTNVRADHMDTMGAGIGQVAETLALSVPERGKAFIGADGVDEGLREIFARAGRNTEAETRYITADDRVRSMCARFGYPMFAENLALALAVCAECGVDQEAALRGMLKVQPDPGVRASVEFAWRGMLVRAVNAFAANDTQSTIELWRSELAGLDRGEGMEGAAGKVAIGKVAIGASGALRVAAVSRSLSASATGGRSRILVFNHRDDRSWRAFQLAEIAEGSGADAVIVFGMSGRLARRLLRGSSGAAAPGALGPPSAPSRKHGRGAGPGDSSRVLPIRALRASESSAEAVLEAALGMLASEPAGIDLLCAGNIKGPGMALTESLEALRGSSLRRA